MKKRNKQLYIYEFRSEENCSLAHMTLHVIASDFLSAVARAQVKVARNWSITAGRNIGVVNPALMSFISK
jgi:hypothetical protein